MNITKEATVKMSPRSFRFGHSSRKNSSFTKYFSLIPSLTLFLGGIFVGLLIGNLPQSENVNVRVTSSPFIDSSGWKRVNVFYGSTDIVEATLPHDQKWYSQARQDEVVLSLLRHKRNGFFVDLAANDATTLSNTYSLERYFGWRGICIEPNAQYFYNLTHFRPNCELVAAVVGRQRMEKVHFHNAGDHSGIAGKEFDNPERFKSKSKQEYTVTLLEIFEKFNSPKVIDYLSLDVEGAEHFIMQNFPLNDYKVKLMTIERPKDELRDLLTSHGYAQIQRLSRWGETLWAHKDIMNQLDTTELDQFNAKKQHLAAKALEEERLKGAKSAS